MRLNVHLSRADSAILFMPRKAHSKQSIRNARQWASGESSCTPHGVQWCYACRVLSYTAPDLRMGAAGRARSLSAPQARPPCSTTREPSALAKTVHAHVPCQVGAGTYRAAKSAPSAPKKDRATPALVGIRQDRARDQQRRALERANLPTLTCRCGIEFKPTQK